MSKFVTVCGGSQRGDIRQLLRLATAYTSQMMMMVIAATDAGGDDCHRLEARSDLAGAR